MDINILMATSNSYAPYLAACMASVLDNSDSKDIITLYLACFTGELDHENVEKIRMLSAIKEYRVELVEIDRAEVAGFYESLHTMNMYLRLFVPEKLLHLDKILYLDCDMIVLESLRELYSIDIGDSILGASLDADVIFRSGHVWEYEKKINTEYFNSGLLLMNLKVMREVRFTETVQNWLQSGRELMFPDQDALNSLYKDRMVILPLKYNAQFPLLDCMGSKFFPKDHPEYKDLLQPTVIHFCTQQKPWLYLPQPPYKAEFEGYLAMTPWRGLKQEDKTLKNICRRICRRVLDCIGMKRA